MSGPGQNVAEGTQFSKVFSYTNVSGSLAIDPSKSNLIDISLVGNVTLSVLFGKSPASCGAIILFTVAQDATGGRTVSFDSASFSVASGLTFSTAANAVDIVLGRLLTNGKIRINAVFNLSALATILGGTIDGAVIGGTTPAAGAFTTLSSTGLATLASLAVTGNETDGGYIAQSVGNALTAAGTTRTDALQLAKQINNVTTAAASTGVILPLVSAVGTTAPIIVFNAGANPIKVYGAGSDTIDGVAAATGVTLTNAKRAIFYPVAAATYISAQLGVVAA